jgi:hypothetical protein
MPIDTVDVKYDGRGLGGQRLAQAAIGWRVVSISAEAAGGAGANEVRFTFQAVGLNGLDIESVVPFFAWSSLTAHGAPAAPAAGPAIAVITGHNSDAGAFFTNFGVFGTTNNAGRLVIDLTDTTANATNWMHVSTGAGPAVAARGIWGTG